MIGIALFDTAIGQCGIGWGLHGIRTVLLPASKPNGTMVLLRKRCPGAEETAPPPEIARAIEGIQALLEGEKRDLREVALDMTGVPDFNVRVYQIARAIPPGETLTYGEIAKRLGDPLLARDVGQALGQNPFAPVVPCHRVLAAGGKMGGFSAPGGVETKRRMLQIEGADAVMAEPELPF
ncbi:MAG TPA: methylated-DNA--[protein]-cysteine S-methyltransferase [Aliidongia sp.]|nr:methylated-DNA--[protein]-cysteine S-methyltransferase [Aliidongia sp.]